MNNGSGRHSGLLTCAASQAKRDQAIRWWSGEVPAASARHDDNVLLAVLAFIGDRDGVAVGIDLPYP